MAYNTNAPQGLKPVRYQDGTPYTGKTNRYRIAGSYATAIGLNDPVAVLSDGTIGIATAGSSFRGVATMFEFTDSNGIYRKQVNWPAAQAIATGTTAYVYVADDPLLVFDAQETNGSSAAGTPLALADVGLNINFVIGAPNSQGVSTTSINNTTEANTSSLNLKIIGLSDYPGNAVGAFANWFVIPNNHDFKAGTTGI